MTKKARIANVRRSPREGIRNPIDPVSMEVQAGCESDEIETEGETGTGGIPAYWNTHSKELIACAEFEKTKQNIKSNEATREIRKNVDIDRPTS